MATLNVRIDARTLERIEQLASQSGRSRSEVAREALERLLAGQDEGDTRPATVMAHLIGCWDGPSIALSERTGERFAKTLKENVQRGSRRRRASGRSSQS